MLSTLRDTDTMEVHKVSKYLSFRNMLLLIILLIFMIICLYIQRPSNTCIDNGILSNLSCYDGNGCTDDFLKDNETCQYRNKKNGATCDDNNMCFNHTLCTPTCELCNNGGDCQKPECVGPRDCCLGLCEVDADCANKITFLVQSYDYRCLYDSNGTNGACVYEIYNTQTNNPETCLGLVEGPVANCMFATTSDSNVVDGYCFFNWKCAPPLTGLSPEV
jgi:hypothetical protein